MNLRWQNSNTFIERNSKPYDNIGNAKVIYLVRNIVIEFTEMPFSAFFQKKLGLTSIMQSHDPELVAKKYAAKITLTSRLRISH